MYESVHESFSGSITVKSDRVISRPVRAPMVRLLYRAFILLVLGLYVAYIIVEVALSSPENLLSGVGYLVYVAMFFIFSASPAKVRLVLIPIVTVPKKPDSSSVAFRSGSLTFAKKLNLAPPFANMSHVDIHSTKNRIHPWEQNCRAGLTPVPGAQCEREIC